MQTLLCGTQTIKLEASLNKASMGFGGWHEFEYINSNQLDT
jgi:hypothetical protein